MLKSQHFWKTYLPPHILLMLFLVFGNNINFVSALIEFFVFYVLISGLGVAVGLHRYFSHSSFKTTSLWEQTMLFFGCLSCQGTPLFWVALHNGLHHRYADTEKDPHSPIHGLWKAYQGYSFTLGTDTVPLKAGAKFLRNKQWSWSTQHYQKILMISWIVIISISLLINFPELAIGFFAAQVWAIHQEALVNLLGHTNGFGAYRNYDIPDKSVNRPLLSLITWGQALHNNHHGNRNVYNFGGIKKFEFDPSVLIIKAIKL